MTDQPASGESQISPSRTFVDEESKRTWYEAYPPGHPMHEATAAMVDLFARADPAVKCRFIWQQLFPSIPWSAEVVCAWLETEHNVPRSRVHLVTMIEVLELLRQKPDPYSVGRKKRQWLEENPHLLDKQFESLRTKNKTRVRDAGGGGRGPWQFTKSLCHEYGLNCPEFSESSP